MTWTNALRRFAVALVTSLGMLAIGAGFLGAALDRHAIAKSGNEHALADLHTVTGRLEDAQRDEPAMRRALERFITFQKEGLIGEERRLDWGERVNRIKVSRKIPVADFELSPQRIIGQPFPDLALRASRMTLRARLAHEGDLLRLLADLDTPGSALVLPRRCTLERESGPVSENPTAISSSCELDWVTLHLNTPSRP